MGAIANIIQLFGGLALFLFGMSLMGANLKKVAGASLEGVLEKLTSNRILGVLLGAVVTAVIQSSSATSVMVIGFVNSGIMHLSQAIGVIMGANIGTTATSWILSLSSISGSGAAALLSSMTIAAIIALVGIVFYMFLKKQKSKHIGGIMLGFAVLMYGMGTMSDAVAPLKDSQAFVNMLRVFSNPILGILVGILFTAIIQSSSASVGVLQALSISVGIKYSAVIPLVLGMNIGACVPVLIAGFSANKNGKRTGLVYLYYNVLGTLAFMILYYGIGIFYDFGEIAAKVSDPVGIAIFNTIYKLFSTIVLLPFTGFIEKLVCLSVPDKKGAEDPIEMLDEHFLAYPPLAVERCRVATNNMSYLAYQNLSDAISMFDRWDEDVASSVRETEETIDLYEDKLGTYLVKLNSKEMSPEEVREVTRCLHSIGDIERIGDHAVNILESAEEMKEKKLKFSPDAAADLNRLSNALNDILNLTLVAFEKGDTEIALRVEPLEETIDVLCTTLKSNHVERLRKGECTLELGFIINDLLTGFERVADHCSNIAACVLQTAGTHEYLRNYKEESGFNIAFEEYKNKYGVR